MAETSGTNRWKKTKDTRGQGGQGQIFVVVDGQGQLAGQYAFKQLLNPKRESRLKNEFLTTKNLFALGAPVLRIVDDYLSSEPDAKNPWYVTPIVPAGNLRYWIKRQFPSGSSEDWTLEFFKRYAEGLRQIHRSGVAHRDLKPENILMDQDGHPIFCDLGLCLPIDEDMGINITTQDLERIGSLHYTPREGYGGSRVKGEAQFAFDIFASGKILHELLSGRVLPGLENHRSPDYDLIRLKGNDFSRSVNHLCRK